MRVVGEFGCAGRMVGGFARARVCIEWRMRLRAFGRVSVIDVPVGGWNGVGVWVCGCVGVWVCGCVCGCVGVRAALGI